MAKLVDIANEIYQDLDYQSGTSIAAIASWLRANIGKLNTLLDLEYSIDKTTMEVSPEIGEEEKDIFKEIYFIKYYTRLANSNLGAAASQNLSAISDDSSSVKWSNKGDVAKGFLALKKESQATLNNLINSYKINHSRPLDIIGDDELYGDNTFITPLQNYRSIIA